MNRGIRRLGQLLIGRRSHEHIRCFAADLEFVKIIVLQNFDMVQTAFDHRVGTGFAVFVQQMLFQRARIHPDTDRTVVIARRFDHFPDALFVADVARIDAQTGSPASAASIAAFVVEMDVCHHGHRAFAHDFFHRFGGCLIRHRHPHNIRAGLIGCMNLGQRAFDISGQRVGHGLHRNRCIALQQARCPP